MLSHFTMNSDLSWLDPCVRKVQTSKDQISKGVEGTDGFQSTNILLPIELWNLVLGELKDPKDILACCDVCVNWNLLLQPKLTSAYFELILPHVASYLNPHEVLCCSAVSKDWNGWVDTSVQNLRKSTPFLYVDDDYPPDPDEVVEIFPHMWIFSVEKMDEIVSEKDSFGALQYDNPVVYRNVCIWKETLLMTDAQFSTYCQSLVRLLSRFGQYVHQLEIEIYEDCSLRITRLLLICLANTPNLQNLKCDFGCSPSFYDLEHEHGEINQQVDDFLEASPLPDSPFKRLQIDYTPWKLVEVLTLRYQNQLEYNSGLLRLFNQYVHNHILDGVLEWIPVQEHKFQNLKVLHVDLRSLPSYDLQSSLYDLAFYLHVFPLKLSELDVIFDARLKFSEDTYEDFFEYLQECPPASFRFRCLDGPKNN